MYYAMLTIAAVSTNQMKKKSKSVVRKIFSHQRSFAVKCFLIQQGPNLGSKNMLCACLRTLTDAAFSTKHGPLQAKIKKKRWDSFYT